jgi:hypothetical protein
MPTYRTGLAVIGAALLTAAAPVAAAHAESSALTGTRIVLSPATQSVSYSSPTVTIQGTLETLVPPGTTPQGLGGQQVSIALGVAGRTVTIPLTTATTNASGQFTATVTVPSPGTVEATFAGTSAYAAVTGFSSLKAAATLPARFVFNPVQPSAVYAAVTATGQLQMQAPGGSWVPAPYAPVHAVQGTDISSLSGWTDANGDFTVTFQANPAFPLQLWSPSPGGPGAVWSGPAFSALLVVPLTVFPTQAQLYAPSIEDLRDMSFGGSVDYVNSQDQLLPLSGAAVSLCYQPMDSKTCIPRAAATTTADGSVTFSHVSGYLPGGKLALVSGIWYLNVAATATDLASDAWLPEQVDVPVWLNDVRVTHSGRRSYLTGFLDEDDRSGPVAGQVVTIHWDHGRHKATARTGKNGEFSFKLTGRPRGVYEVTYSGGKMAGGAFIPATTREHAYVTYKP